MLLIKTVCFRNVPDPAERELLKRAGLGEKRFPIEVHSEAQELYQEFLYHYPKLADGGGYELLRMNDGRSLDVITEPSNGYSVEFFKSVVSSAKIYIRPLQMSLDTEENVASQNKLLCMCSKLFYCNCISWVLS